MTTKLALDAGFEVMDLWNITVNRKSMYIDIVHFGNEIRAHVVQHIIDTYIMGVPMN